MEPRIVFVVKLVFGSKSMRKSKRAILTLNARHPLRRGTRRSLGFGKASVIKIISCDAPLQVSRCNPNGLLTGLQSWCVRNPCVISRNAWKMPLFSIITFVVVMFVLKRLFLFGH